MKRVLLTLALASFLFALAGCQGGQTIPQAETSPPPLSALRTPYLGNPSAVFTILGQLPMPADGWVQQFTAMSNASQFGSPELAPYTLTVFYHPADDIVAIPTEDTLPIAAFEYNAGWLFALIDNLLEVTFAMRTTPLDGNELHQETYTLYWTIARQDATLPEIYDTTE
ncbi:MAG: DUF4825 domain-containing protein [Oscillospiraceae bacterium]|nr:DUF4825 domain-containing protein [Oscillospiraceae bacterium]